MALLPTSGSKRSRDRWWWLAGRFGLVALAILGTGLLIMNKTMPQTFGRVRGRALDTITPALDWLGAPVRGASAFADWFNSYVGARSKAEKLSVEVARLRLLSETNQNLSRENQRLKTMLHMSEPSIQVLGAVRVVGSTSGSMLQSALITAGYKHGVANGQPVRDTEGLIGQVLEVGAVSARVLLVTDTTSRVPVRIVRTGLPAMISGSNSGLLKLLYVDPDNPVVTGDMLVTSGQGGLFPPNIPVATVVNITTPEPLARPAARLTGLDYALVLKPYVEIFIPPVVTAPPAPQKVTKP